MTRVGKQCRQTISVVIVDTCWSATGRVSTADQNRAHQIDALRRSGVEPEQIYIDTASGAKASRPKWDLVRAPYYVPVTPW